jgi:hypothetical protein
VFHQQVDLATKLHGLVILCVMMVITMLVAIGMVGTAALLIHYLFTVKTAIVSTVWTYDLGNSKLKVGMLVCPQHMDVVKMKYGKVIAIVMTEITMQRAIGTWAIVALRKHRTSIVPTACVLIAITKQQEMNV